MITNLWHSWLDMPKYDQKWHRDDIKDELREYEGSRGFFNRWSEVSDVVYTYTRARWTGHKKINWPLKWWQLFWGLLYMYPKYTLRWWFFHRVGKRFHKHVHVTEVRNPKKETKLREIARRNKLDEEEFVKECRRLEKYWIFLP